MKKNRIKKTSGIVGKNTVYQIKQTELNQNQFNDLITTMLHIHKYTIEYTLIPKIIIYRIHIS